MRKYLTNIPLKEGLNTYIKTFENITYKTEYVDVEKSLGRKTSEAIFANLSNPFYNCSAMDGIAVVSNKTYLANEQNLVELVEYEDYIEVDTGDPIPKGYDAVIMIEDLLEKENGVVKIIKPAIPWQHIRCLGEDIVEKEMVLPSYHTIRSQDVASMISSRIDNVPVFKKLKVGIIPTGTELIDRNVAPKVGDIIEFNSRLFSGMLMDYKCEPIIYPIVQDNYNKIKDVTIKALEECDMVLINAGSSQGREDYTYSVIEELGQVVIHGLAIKPGKPAILGEVNNKPVIGIPGYPVSAWVVMDNVVKAVISHFTNEVLENTTKVKATLTRRIMSSLKYEEFIRVNVGFINNKYIVTPLKRGAGTITTLVNADGIIRIPQNIEGLGEGEEIEVELLNDTKSIMNKIVSIGSHDMVLDILNDEITRKSYGKLNINSSHVGSFNGLLAIKKDEAHIAPIHLFDIESETYNTPYIEKFLDNDVAIIKLVKRTQGLIVAKGNPLKINGVGDLKNIRYINRQKGSGTRVLFDYLLSKNNIKKSSINGYDREEYTHTSLAKAIENNDADCGLGVYSVAKMFDLDFIPICEEEYDLLIKKNTLENDYIVNLLDVIKNEMFKSKIKILGGYSTENSGDIIYL